MAILRLYRRLAMAGILFLFAESCKTNEKKKEVGKADTTAVLDSPFLDSAWDSTASNKKCFGNKGLTYDVVITIEEKTRGTIIGTVESRDLESEQSSWANFSGTSDGKTINIKFEGNPPVVGKASEWTDKPWRLVEKVGKSSFPHMLHIPFRAKNYETNKWEESDYIFAPIECSN